jgi:hypothetical protein
MSGNAELLVNSQYTKARRGDYRLTLARSQDWARPWPNEDGVSPFFRLITLPVRLLALALFWATSAPGRLLFAGGLATVATVALIAH